MRAAGRRRLLPAAIVPVLVALLVAGCGEINAGPEPEREKPPGAGQHTIASSDGTRLDARLWERDPGRVIIYFHEYLSDQSLWWPHIDARGEDAASALTVDFRGHGESPGEPDDFDGVLEDAQAALEWVRGRGYGEVTLVGSGMGAAVAMKVAHGEPDLWVIGLSAPSEFSHLMPIDVAPGLRERLVLIATEGDLSAAHSLELFVEAAELPEERWRLFDGRAHGVEMLTFEGFEAAREYFLEMLAESWAAR